MTDEIKELEELSERLAPLKKRLDASASSPLPSLAARLVEKSGHWLIQQKHAFVPEKTYRSVEAPGFRAAFKPLYPRQSVVQDPAVVDVILMEDGILSRKRSAHDMPLHGLAVAACAGAAWEALTGEPHLRGLLYNRSPYEGMVGPSRKPLLGPEMPNAFMDDMAEPSLRARLKTAEYHIVSTSTGYFNKSLTSPAKRKAHEKRLTDYFGENTLFIQAAGNVTAGERQMNHSVFANHPGTLQVGACQSITANDHPATPRPMHMESYSGYVPDVVWETMPHHARSLDFSQLQNTHMHQFGTSMSAPQAAVILQLGLQNFAPSARNPQRVLPMEDIRLALLQTAQPLHSAEYDSFSYSVENPMRLFDVARIGNHYFSNRAGCGAIDIEAFLRQLSRMERAVKTGEAHIRPRLDIEAELKPVSARPDSDAYYHYRAPLAQARHADMIFIDAEIQSHIEPWQMRTMLLISPKGERIELFPSDHYDAKYRIGRTSAFHGEPLTGDWTLLSNEPLKSAQIRFSKTMAPDHVAVTHAPDWPTSFRHLYRRANLNIAYTKELDERMLATDASGTPAIASHDFSATRFPAGYLELRLMHLAATPGQQAHAMALASSGAKPFRNMQNALQEAIGRRDSDALLALLAPDAHAVTALAENAIRQQDDKGILTLLARSGASAIKMADGTPLFNQLVRDAHHKMLGNSAAQIARVQEAINVLRQHGNSILQPDSDHETVMDYVLHPALQTVLQQGMHAEKYANATFMRIMDEFAVQAGLQAITSEQIGISPSKLNDALRGVDIRQLRQAVQAPPAGASLPPTPLKPPAPGKQR